MDKKIEIIQLNQINKDMDEDDNISVKYVSFNQNEPSMYENIPESSEYAVVYGTVKEYQNVKIAGKGDVGKRRLLAIIGLVLLAFFFSLDTSSKIIAYQIS